MRELGLYLGLDTRSSGLRASFSASVAHDATAGVVGTIAYSGNSGAVSIVGGATTDEAGNNGGLFSVDVSLNVTFDVDAISLSAGQSLTTSDTITLTDGTTSVPVSLNITVTNSTVAETSIYAYPNSLWVNGATVQVPYWLGAMEETDSTNIFYDGEAAAFFANGAGFPSANPLNFIQGATGMRSHNTENPGDDYTNVVFVANNFSQGDTVSTGYTNHRDRMSALITHWRGTLGQDPVFWIQEGVVEGTMLTSPVSSATRDEFDDMLDVLRSGSHPAWYDTLLAAIQALQPAADVRLFKAASFFQNVVQGTALIDLDPDDFFTDTDPHGTDTHYAIKAMIIYGYTEGSVTSSSTWTTGLNATFISNYTTIAARIEDLVLGNAVTPQALSSNDWSVSTSSTSRGLDFAITFLPESVTDIDYSTDDGSTWASLGETTTGTYTVTTASGGGDLAGSTAYTTRLRLVNAAGDGQGARSKAGTSAAAADTTAPTLSSPVDAANGETASTASISTNEGNGTLYWVVTASGTAPSVAQIQAGQDDSGAAATDSGNQSVSGTGSQTISPAPSGLSASTAYTTHFQHADAAGNDSTVSSASGFTTADTTAPSLSSPTDTVNGDTASTGSVSTDEGNGTLYWVVTTSATAPSVAQIQAGQDNSGASAAASGSQSVSGTGVQNISPSGLTASTAYTTHYQQADAAANDSTVVSASGFTTAATPDVTAPTLSSATDAENGDTASTASVSTNEGNGTLYVVVTTSGTAPSVAQIQAGQDNSGAAAAFDASQSVTGTGVQTISPAPSGLSASTAYTTHFQHADASGNDSTVASASGFTTDAAADVTAPTLSSATDAADGSTASTASVSTNEGNGTLYWVVTTSATAPSVAQIQAGQDNSGTAATDSGSQSVSGTGVQTVTPAPSGLTASTAYTTHFQQEDTAGNDSTVASASGFTTGAAASAQWTSWMTAGTVAIDGANAGGEWDPAPSVSVLASADNSNANLFIGSSTAEYAEGVFATNFGFDTGDIPSSSTINGIEVRFVDSQSDIAGRPWYYTNVFITVDGSTNDGTAKNPTSDTVTSATGDTITIPSTGGATDVWGTSITDSEVRGTNFGIHFSCGATGDTPVLAATDQLEIRVNYT